MRDHSYSISLLFFLSISILVAWNPEKSWSQNRVQILQTDILEGVTGDEGRIRKLTGNVQLKTDDFTIACDSAWQFLDLDELRAWGNIDIQTERERIWADKAIYDLVSEVTFFQGRVKMQSKRALLFSEEVYYSFATEIALFPERLRLEDERGVLLADSGYYFQAIDSAAFRGNVQASDSLQYMEADSMFTHRGKEYHELFGRVFFEDIKNRTRLTGGFVVSDSTGYRRVEGGSQMERISEDLADTTFLWCDRLEIIEGEDSHSFSAFGDVQILAPDYSSLSDTTHYDEEKGHIILHGNSRLWYDQMQLTGPYIFIQMEEEEIHFLESHERPFAVQKDSVTSRHHQMTGDTLSVHFKEGKLSEIRVFPAGNVLYFVKDSDENPDGAMELSANLIILYFSQEEELEEVSAKKNIEGVYHPEEEGISQKRLEGYVYEPDLRPEKPKYRLEPRLPPVPLERPFKRPERKE